MRTLPDLPLPFAVEHLYDADRAGGFSVVRRERRRVLARRDDGVFLWAYLRHGHTVVRTEVVRGAAATALSRTLVAGSVEPVSPRFGAVTGGPPLSVRLPSGDGARLWYPDVEVVDHDAANIVVSGVAYGEADVEALRDIATRCARTHSVFVARAAPSLVGHTRDPARVAEVFAGRSHAMWSSLRDAPESRWLCLTLGDPHAVLDALLEAFVFDGLCGEIGEPHPLEEHGVAVTRAVSVARPSAFSAPDGEAHHNHFLQRTLLAARVVAAMAGEADPAAWVGELVGAPESPLLRGRIEDDELCLLLAHGGGFRWVTLALRSDGPSCSLSVRPRMPRISLAEEPTPFLDERLHVPLPREALRDEPLASVGETWRVDAPAEASWQRAQDAVEGGATAELQVARFDYGDAPVFVVVQESTWDEHAICARLGERVASREIGDLDASVRSPGALPPWFAAFARHLLAGAVVGERALVSDRVSFPLGDRVGRLGLAAGHRARILLEDHAMLCEVRGTGSAHSRLAIHALRPGDLHLPYVDPSDFDEAMVADRTVRFRRDVQRGRVVRDAEVPLSSSRVLYVVSEVEADWDAHVEMLAGMTLGEAAAAQHPRVASDWRALYEIEDRLGQGGAADVHRVRHRGWAMDLAMKRPRADAASMSETLTHEAEAWTKLGPHPNVVSCYQARRLEGVPHIFVELALGGSLADWIEDGRLYAAVGDASRFSSEETHRQASAFARILDVGIQVAHGLHHAHEHGLIHQDVKPANVMMSDDGVAKVTDFGLVKASRTEHEVEMGGTVVATCGGLTPAYCSPEQATAASTGDKLTRRTDIWSWAVMMLEMFNGGVTWRSGALAQVVLRELREHGASESVAPPLPADLADLLAACLSISQADRPHDMLEVATALARIYHQTLGNRYQRRPPRPADGRADVLANRGASLMDLAQTEAAVDAWCDALEVEPMHLEAGYDLALHQHRQGGASLGQRSRDLLHAHPHRWEAHHAHAWTHVERGDGDAALLAIERARALGAPRREVAALREAAAAGLLRSATQRIVAPRALALAGERVVGMRQNTERRALVFVWSLGDNAVVTAELDLRGELLCAHDESLYVVGTASRRGEQRQEIRALRLSDLAESTIDLGPWTSADLDALTAISVLRDAVWLGRESGAVERWHGVNKTRDARMSLFDGAVTAIHAAGDRVACSGKDGRVLTLAQDRVIDVLTVERPTAVRIHDDVVTVVGADGVQRTDPTRRRTRRLRCRGDVALGPLGDHALEHLGGGTLRHWDLRAWRIAREATPRQASVARMVHDGARFVVAYEDETAAAFRAAPTQPAPWLVVRPRTSEQLLADEVAYDDALEQAREALDDDDVARAGKLVARASEVLGFQRAPELFTLRRRIAACTQRGDARGSLLRQVVSSAPWTACRMSADGALALVLDPRGICALWRLPSAQQDRAELLDALHEHRPITDIALSADGQRALLATVEDLGVWSLREQRSVSLGACRRFAMAASGTRAVVVRDVLLCVDLDREVERPLAHGARLPSAVAISADGSHAICGFEDGTVTVWELDDLGIAWQRRGHEHAVMAVAIDDDGTAVSSARDGSRRWDPNESVGVVIQRDASSRITISGGLVASCGAHASVWELATGEVAHVLDPARDIALTADATCAITCSESGLRMWELDWERT